MMRVGAGVAAALLLLGVPAGASAAKAKPKAAAKRPARADWTRTFAVTPEGGFRMGNPKARVALVEYGSLTCSHCRHFAETAITPLVSRYVRTGKASYEFRPFVLNGIDLAATLVARCNGPSHFFPTAGQLYATQPAWIEKIAKLPKEEQDKLNELPDNELMLGVARAGGLIPIAAAHGIPAAKAEACLKNDAAAEALMKTKQTASDQGVKGTPTFLVNGKQVPAYDWATLEPFLREAGG